MSFLHQIRTLTLGTAHDLLDKAIDLNSPTMLRQYCRDLEDAVGKMNSELAIQNGQVITLTRQKSDLEAAIAKDKQTIAALLASSSVNATGLARSRGELVLQNQKRLDALAADLVSQQDTVQKLTTVVHNLQGKYELMLSRVHELERLDRDSKAKESAATALNAAASLANGPSVASIDNVEERIRARNDVASAKFDQSMGSIPSDSDVDPSDLDALMASLTPVAAAK